MAVLITDLCINCGACLDECPVEAIVDEDDNPMGEDMHYVYPDKCVECVGYNNEPACANSCPTEGCIVWDMPFINEHKSHFEQGTYVFEDDSKEQPFRDTISIDDRKNGTPVVD